MVDILSMVDLTSISAMLAATGVLVGVVFAILELRNLVKTRQTDLAIKLYSHFGGKEFQEAWVNVMKSEFKEYDDYKKRHWMDIVQIGTFFEGVGVLLHRKLVDIGIVDDLLPVKIAWERMKPIAEGDRKQLKEPRLYEWFEYLYNEQQKREQRLQTQQ